MSAYFDARRSAECVKQRIADTVPDRSRVLFTSLIDHLHAFVSDVRPSEAEWAIAIQALTRIGQMCDGSRQEWILASDALGVSMLVDAINCPASGDETENTVFGPFHVEGAPFEAMGADLRRDGRGEACHVSGLVRDTDGAPIAEAMLDIWSDAPDGFYDVQKPDDHPPMNLRGRFVTAADGRYHFVTAKPVPYPIPDDGPVGDLLKAMGRHPWRPAHIHFRVTAPGFRPTTTHIFVAGDPYLGSDAVFGVKHSLIVDFVADSAGSARWSAHFDFVLRRTP